MTDTPTPDDRPSGVQGPEDQARRRLGAPPDTPKAPFDPRRHPTCPGCVCQGQIRQATHLYRGLAWCLACAEMQQAQQLAGGADALVALEDPLGA